MTTHLSNLEFVRRKCQEANSSLLKLEFGCEVKIINQYSEYYGRTLTLTDAPDSFGQITLIVPNFYTIGGKIKDTEILGKEPALSDVLLAIGSNSVLKINNLGGFSWFIDNEWKDIALPRWNLLLPFSQQSEETLAFLRSLLEQ